MSKNKTYFQSHEENDTTWQAVYMDLITIVMIFFLVLSVVTKGKDEAESDKIGDYSTIEIPIPGDALFSSGRANLTKAGKANLKKLFKSEQASFPELEKTEQMKTEVVLHGHTDDVGGKIGNLNLGYRRALSVYKELKKYRPEVSKFVSVCTHADNLPEEDPRPVSTSLKGDILKQVKSFNKRVRKKNRRVILELKNISVAGD